MLPNLCIEVGLTGGADIHQAIRDAVSLANRLALCVNIAPNGIRMMICPGNDPNQLILEWTSQAGA